MIKNFYLLLILIFGISCSNPAEKQKVTKETVQKEINKIQDKRFSANPTTIISLLRKVKQDAKAIKYDSGEIQCNLILMNNLTVTGNDEGAVKIGKENEKLIKKAKNDLYSCKHYRLIGTAYLNFGLDDQGMSDLKRALEYNKNIEDQNKKYIELAMIYHVLGLHEAIRGDAQGQKVKIYYQKELWAIQNIDNSKEMEYTKNRMLSFLYWNLGILCNKQKKPKEAEDYFHKALDICNKFKITRDAPVVIMNEMSWLLFDQKKYDSCIAYAQKGITFEKNDSKPDIRRDLFEVLYKSYSEKGDVGNSTKYSKLYMNLNDSILGSSQLAISAPVKNIIEAKEEDHQNNLTTILIIVGSSVLALAAIVFFLLRRNQKIQYAKYEKVISQLKNEEKQADVFNGTDRDTLNGNKNLNIHDDTVNYILQKLTKFENSEKFLKKDLTLTFLANSLDTNPRYLSEIIKQYKGKHFNNYLNGLRIHHITQLLYKEPIYREYKITYLAEYCGFASREVFAIAFKKETGVTPSYFINQLRTEEVSK